MDDRNTVADPNAILDGTPVERPVVSVIVPVRNDPDHLRSCLRSLASSTYGRYEVLVVDDASTDETPAVASEFGARLIQLEGGSGPAAARNAGVASARGDYVLFVDSDVCTRPDTIARIVDTFQADAQIDAVFGSYDRYPRARNVLSQYKNLFHHFVHQHARREACTFWTGCGAVKRSVFLQLGGFNTQYTRPCIEDIELGTRLIRAGCRVVLEKSIQVKHLKRWSLYSIVKTDVVDRAVPWTELMLQNGTVPKDLNLKSSQRVCALLSCGLLALLVAGAWHWHGLSLLAFLGLLAIHLLDRWSARGPIPATVQIAAVAAAAGVAASIGVQFRMWTLIPFCLLLAIVFINARFYSFLARERHPLFAAYIAPLHVIYYNYSAMAFVFGVCLYLSKSTRRLGLRATLAQVSRRASRRSRPGPSSIAIEAASCQGWCDRRDSVTYAAVGWRGERRSSHR